MSLKIGSDDHISFACVNLIGKSNEDYSWQNLAEDELYDLATFGVCDGHSGGYGSKYGAQNFHRKVSSKYCEFQEELANLITWSDTENTPWKLLSLQDKSDAILCKALHDSVTEIDDHVRSKGNSGTTLAMLMLRKTESSVSSSSSSSSSDMPIAFQEVSPNDAPKGAAFRALVANIGMLITTFCHT